MDKPLSRGEQWTCAVVLVIVLGLFGLEIAIDFAPAKLGALALVLAWVPLLAIHEGGHAVMARLLGQRVDAVVVGFGRTLWRGALFGVALEVRSLPVEGFTLTRGSNNRLATALVYFAGPAAELLIAGALVLVVGSESMFARTNSVAVICAQGVALAAVASAVLNLIPAEVRQGGPGGDSRSVANDGLGILRSLLGR